MTFKKTPLFLVLTTVVAFLPNELQAAKPSKPANLEELWKVIQQQQKEIEMLKIKADENKALKKEVETLKGEPTNTTKSAGSKSKTGLSETERKTDILASEVEKIKTQLFIPEKREYKSQFGMGPAASEVYKIKRGLSIGGYGEWFYTNYGSQKGFSVSNSSHLHDNGRLKDTFDSSRAVLYIGYKFNDWIILNNEIEFEHGGTEGGEVSSEFSQLDFLLHPMANIRAGLMLIPMGFINEIHEPTTFHGNRRPEVERYIIPSTWREMGAGLFGEIAPGLEYRMFAVNGLDAADYETIGIKEGRQSGTMGLAEDFAFVGRLDYSIPHVPGLLVGGSAYVGNSGQDRLFMGKKIDALTQLYEGHVEWHYRGFEFRALGAYGHIGDASVLSAYKGETIGSANYGWYTELAYDVVPLLWKDSTQYFAPFFRYERYDTLADVPTGWYDDPRYDRWIYQAGFTYKPIPNIAVKLDFRNIESAAHNSLEELNLGVGLIY